MNAGSCRRIRDRIPPALLFVAALAYSAVASAEVVFDGTIGPNPDGTTRSGDVTIAESDGAVLGPNLFHSFRLFNVGAGESATFTATSPTVQNVIARVTGNQTSTIAGLVGADPGLNLHFLNPTGILFLPGAQVDVSGSVYLTTADSLRFDGAGGTTYLNVADPVPTLSADPPTAFGFRPGATGTIGFDGTSVPVGSATMDFVDDANVSLIASDISVTQIDVRAEAGLIRVAAAGTSGTEVPLDVASWSPTDDVASAGEVRLTSFSSFCADTVYCQGGAGDLADRGRIVLRAGRLVLQDSQIIAGGDGVAPLAIDLETSGETTITGRAAFVTAFGTGPNPVGGLRIDASRIEVSNSDFGVLLESGRSDGALELVADQIVLDDAPVEAHAQGDGVGPDVHLQTGTLSLSNGSFVRTISEAGVGVTGDAGAIFIEADTVDLSGASDVESLTGGSGGAGRVIDGRRLGVRIDAGDLTATGGSQISTSTDAAGDAGNIEIALTGHLFASDVVTGGAVPRPSGIFARSGSAPGSPATGNGGLVDVSAGSIEIANGAEVSVVTLGSGAAGSLSLVAVDAIRIDGANTSVNARGNTGPAGNITIHAHDVTVSGSAEVAAEALLGGDAGAIDVQAGGILDIRGGSILTRLRQAGLNPSGGDISLGAGSAVLVRDGGVVSSQGASLQKAGDVRISSPGLVSITNNGLVSARATNAGDAGSIQISAGQFEAVQGFVTTESTASAGGSVAIAAVNTFDLTDASVRTSVLQSGDGSGGDVTLTGNRVVINRSDVFARAIEGPGGNILVEAQNLLISEDSNLSASSALNVDGEILLRSPDTNLIDRLSDLPENVLDASTLFADRCASRQAERVSSFIVGQRDRTPASPDAWLPATGWGVIGPIALESVEVDPARAALRRGDLASAAGLFSRSAEHPDATAELRVFAHLAAADALDGLGGARDAEQQRQSARAIAETLGNPRLVALASADLAAALDDPSMDSSLESLTSAMSVLKEHGTADDRARVQHQLGNAHALAGDSDAARRAFARAAAEAAAAAAPLPAARARAVAARLAVEAGDVSDAVDLLGLASGDLANVPTSHATAETRIHLGETWRRLGARVAEAPALAYAQLLAAQQEAEAAGDDRIASAAWGGLSRLYADEGRIDEALQLARTASGTAQRVHATELLYRWERQVGTLLARTDDRRGAIRAYERSIELLESLRFERPPPGRRHREDVADVYYEQVDLLLQDAGTDGDESRTEGILRQARTTIEDSKAAELRDYFRDACVDALANRARSIDEVSEGAVIVYPIPLADRLALLVSVPGQPLRQLTVDVTRTELEQDVRSFRRLLTKRTTHQYLAPARRLYDHLVRPLEPVLADSGARTLVFVPDGSLRTIPMAALHDGEQFLVEKFALAISPSIDLTDPRPLPTGELNVLLGGLSVEREGFPALDFVPREIAALHAAHGGDVLIDRDFTIPALEERVSGSDYNVVHLATHAEFLPDSGDSFLLTHDGRLTVDRLEGLIGHFRYRDEPLELLGLSACETAAGDDRAALGLSGIAVRAGARSVLGTLWVVNDEAASELVVRFYDEIGNPGATRAEALRRAQRQVLAEPTRRHPFYWSPFVLINSWL